MAKRKKRTHTGNTYSILDKSGEHQQFDFAEVFRHIRTNIEYSGTDQEITSVSVTSTQAGEAKSTVSMNLAYIFAAKYKKVLIIDADLRKRTLHKYMNLPNDEGLTDAVREFGKTHMYDPKFFKVLEHESFAGNLFVLTSGTQVPNPTEVLGTSGTQVPNPTEVLGSKSFADYMKELKKHFDFIIVDCSPVLQTSDPVPVGNAVDGTIFVVSAQDTNRKDATAAVEMLKRNKVNILGSVLTKAEMHDASAYYYYY